MIAVHYFFDKKEVLHRLQDTVPTEGEQIRLKGRKGTVLSLVPINENNVYVHIYLEPKKPKFVPLDPRKKNRR